MNEKTIDDRRGDIICKVNLLAHGDPAKVDRGKTAHEICEAVSALALEVRRVEDHERERVVRERQACEVREYVRVHHDWASPDCAGSADVYRVRLAALVHEQRPVICLIEPEHAASTAGVEHGRE